MKERPILFSGEMVRAILDGRKTQTRRILKQQPDERHRNIILSRHVLKEYLKEKGLWQLVKETSCPYGKPQDVLWVKETVVVDRKTSSSIALSKYAADGNHVVYKTNDDFNLSGVHWDYRHDTRPSIFMPRKYSRIDLLIKDIRVERLQDISEEDAIAEGVYNLGTKRKPEYCIEIAPFTGFRSSKAVECFRELWTSINGPESWDANPWVWVVDFERIQPDSKPEAA